MSRKITIACLLALLLAALWVGGVVAQVGSGFDLSWHVVGGGGWTSTGSGFSVSGTAAQTAIGSFSGSGFTAGNGYWQWQEYRVALPVTLRNH